MRKTANENHNEETQSVKLRSIERINKLVVNFKYWSMMVYLWCSITSNIEYGSIIDVLDLTKFLLGVRFCETFASESIEELMLI